MKRKILTIILSVLLIILIGTTIYKSQIFNKRESSKTDTNRNFILSENSNSVINKRGENSGIYVGTTENEDSDNYLFISIKMDKSGSKEDQAKTLISEISNAISYKIDINDVKIEGNKISVDFAKTAAPFDISSSNLQIEPKFFIASDYAIPKTIFDSINKTFKSYFGANTEVYFSADSEDINIENEILPISIDSNKAY